MTESERRYASIESDSERLSELINVLDREPTANERKAIEHYSLSLRRMFVVETQLLAAAPGLPLN
jgi:hypothetical protein